MARKILLDTDTAGDDVQAILLACLTGRLSVEAVTVVAGNVTPAAEYNVWVDPDAKRVFDAFEVTLVDWGLSLRASVLPADGVETVLNMEGALASVIGGMIEAVYEFTRTEQGIDGVPQPDSLTAALLAYPELRGKMSTLPVVVDEREGLTRGYLSTSCAICGQHVRPGSDASIEHCRRSKLALEPIQPTDTIFPYGCIGSKSSMERQRRCFPSKEAYRKGLHIPCTIAQAVLSVDVDGVTDAPARTRIVESADGDAFCEIVLSLLRDRAPDFVLSA